MRFRRSSGILLHPTSLPGPHGSGDFGPAAYHFVDWLVAAGQSVWQMLPLGPVGMGNSPYMSYSAFAGEPMLIGLDEFVAKGWLNPNELQPLQTANETRIHYGDVTKFRMQKLRFAAETFFARGSAADILSFDTFCAQNESWLEDYSLFMSLVEQHERKEWSTWPKSLVRRESSAIGKAKKELAAEMRFWKFTQWTFFRQWTSLKKYANERGVMIVGDIPIFVAYQSADVWSRPELFYLDDDFCPTVVAGVPPDYFSETGQRWGNPLYRWDVMEKQNFSWWIERIRTTLSLVDAVRIDHFRGFAAYWEIPATEKTAVKGKWIEGPKERLFEAINKALGRLPIIAEDLGVITPDVVALRDRFSFPGMKILQFAFASDMTNPFLPHNYDRNIIVYTGTHDNDTTRGWFASATERERTFVTRYLGTDSQRIEWDLMRAASGSVADWVVFPMQDILSLGTEHRMNYPGKPLGNWEWRFHWDLVKPYHAERLLELTALYSRCAPDRISLPAYPSGKKVP